MFGGSIFPAITTLLTLLIFYIEKMIENIVTNGFDGASKHLTVTSFIWSCLQTLSIWWFLHKGCHLFPHLEI